MIHTFHGPSWQLTSIGNVHMTPFPDTADTTGFHLLSTRSRALSVTMSSLMFSFSDPELEAAPLSTLRPEQLLAMGLRDVEGVRCLLFPAQGGQPLCLNIPFHDGYENQRRSIDLDFSKVIDVPDENVLSLSNTILLANPYPPETNFSLPNGYCIFSSPVVRLLPLVRLMVYRPSPQRGMETTRNKSLAGYFNEPYVIHGNVLVAQMAVDGVEIEDIDDSRVHLVRHIVAR
jgi:hypothetical protein